MVITRGVDGEGGHQFPEAQHGGAGAARHELQEQRQLLGGEGLQHLGASKQIQ